MMRTQVIGNAGDAVVATVTHVANWLGQHGGEVASWIQSNSSQLVDWATQIVRVLGIGPSYDASNGGEVIRQLSSTSPRMDTDPIGQSYMEWLRSYHPYTWDTGYIWEDNVANFSRYAERYRQLVSAGMTPGALVDRDMVPIGLAAAAAAIDQAEQAGATQPGSTGNNVRPTGSGPGTVVRPGGTRPNATILDSGNGQMNKSLLIGAGLLLVLLFGQSRR